MRDNPKTLIRSGVYIYNIHIIPTDCHASGPDASYGCRHIIPSAVSLAGVWA